MKNLNVRILFFFSSFLHHAPNLLAQTTTMRDVLNTAFVNVDKSRVPTKYLKEYGYNFMPMNVFNGVLADSNVLDTSAWRLLYGSFLTFKNRISCNYKIFWQTKMHIFYVRF